jgi:UbiD family decarboxylase
MDFREFLTGLEKSGDLLRYKKEADPYLEIAKILASSSKPVLFEKAKGSPYRVVGNLAMSRDLIARYLGVDKSAIVHRMARAFERQILPVMAKKGACQEVVQRDVNLEQFPVLTHFKDDDGAYMTTSILVIKDSEGHRNIAFHRLKRIGKDRVVARICARDTYKCLQSKGGESEVAICLGNVPSILLAAATSPPTGFDEFNIAGSLEGRPIELVKCKTVDLEVPANCEIVLEGKITKETADEGKFVDMSKTYDVVRKQPVIKINCITMRKNAIYQALVPGKIEHHLLMGLPREPGIFKAVKDVCDCKNVFLTPGGCTWYHGLVQIKKWQKDDGRKAIEAAFKGHRSMKGVVVVDEDINIFDPNDVEWAIATRFQADRDLIVYKDQPGSSVDPSARDVPDSDRKLTAKWGLDATIPFDGGKKEFLRPV